MQNFYKFSHLKPTFSILHIHFLQNTHINLSILHIYSIIFILLPFFYYFLTHCLSLSLSHRPNHHHHHPATIKPKPTQSEHLATTITHLGRWTDPFNSKPTQFEHLATIINHLDWRTNPFKTHWSCRNPKPRRLVALGPWRRGFRRSQQCRWWGQRG